MSEVGVRCLSECNDNAINKYISDSDPGLADRLDVVAILQAVYCDVCVGVSMRLWEA